MWAAACLVMMVVWIFGRKATPPAEQRGWLDLGVSQCTRERERPLHPHAAYMLSSCFFAARLHYTTRCVLRPELNLVVEGVWVCVGRESTGSKWFQRPCSVCMRLLGLVAAAVSERVPLQRCRVSKGRSLNPPRCAHKPSSSTPILRCYIALAAVAAGEHKGERRREGRGGEKNEVSAEMTFIHGKLVALVHYVFDLWSEGLSPGNNYVDQY